MESMKKIFIIDDDQDIRDVMYYVLDSEGYNAQLFSSAKEALEVLKQEKDLPHAIILDYLMPGMNGVEFLSALTSLSVEVRSIPIAFSSGLGQVEAPAGLNITFLSKPIDIEQLFDFLGNV